MTFDEKLNYIINLIKENLEIIVHIAGEEPEYIFFENIYFKDDFDIRKDRLKIYIINSKPNEMKLLYNNFVFIFKNSSKEHGLARLNFNALKEKLYYLKEYDEIIGTISYPSLKFKKDKNWKKPLPAGLVPLGINYENYNPSPKEVLLFLESRIIEFAKVRVKLKEREKLYDIYFQGKSISNFLKSRGLILDKLLDCMLGMNYRDSLWILPEDKLHMDYDNYHVNCANRE